MLFALVLLDDLINLVSAIAMLKVYTKKKRGVNTTLSTNSNLLKTYRLWLKSLVFTFHKPLQLVFQVRRNTFNNQRISGFVIGYPLT